MPKKAAKKAKHDLIYFFESPVFQAVVWGVAALALTISIYHAFYARKIIPGVYVAGVHVGRLNFNQAVNKLEKAAEETDKTLILTHDNQTYEITAASIGVEYLWEDSVARAYEVGRTGNFYIDTKDKIAGLVKPLRLYAFYDFDEGPFNSILAKISGELNIEAQDAKYVLNEGALEIVPAADGKRVDRDKFYELLITSFGSLDFRARAIDVETAHASVEEADLQSVQKEASDLVLQPMSITFEEKSWPLNSEQLLDFLQVKHESGIVTLGLDTDKFESYLDLLSLEINQLPRGRVTELRDDRVIGFELTQDGKELNTKEFTESFKQAFFEGNRTVQATVSEISGPSDPEKYGILSLLGEGNSKFTGSAPARARNLTLAAERTNGVLVPPGGIYSFNNSVGEISGETGYDSAYIISNGRTILGEGGGVCQTSTTIYRAVLNAGLPIITRNPHAYRVYYYEIDRPVGFDAAIYQPSLDFQFLNDTPNFLLVQSTWDKNAQTLNFKLFGTPDGREVQITEPVVTNVSAPPEALYQDDPTLAKGITKQVDFAAWGATAEYERTVTRNGEIITNDKFKSVYRPWRAVYLVGTKE